ncbi:hypothetical protein FOE78_01515 [Microlunatus elymi]|uniref:Uncharacterized protein n=1 Tax=Microlunatus elymi TaxID=2596828 RepID=A0A516PU99_9ACTN|nr:hypothetical protein [Microlunatus elymi]QDP94768.1 hypothetical protein FOE78_01515 [Microlunatus elymi]
MTEQGAGDQRAADAVTWVDDADPDSSWAPPSAPADPRPRPKRRVLGVGIPVLVVVLVFALVWALGGFDYRDDKITDVAVGKTFANGPYDFTFTQATVQRQKQYDDKVINKVLINGTVRNTWTEAVSPQERWFLAVNRHGTPVEATYSHILRKGDVPDGPSMITPGLPPVAYQIEFEFDKTMNPGKTITLGVGKLTYGNNSAFSSSDEETWDADSGDLYRIRIPLKVLPPKKDDY